MTFLGLSIWFYLVAWVVVAVSAALFCAGCGRRNRVFEEAWEREHATVYDGPLATVVEFPRRPVAVLDAPEYEPPEWINGEERGWVS